MEFKDYNGNNIEESLLATRTSDGLMAKEYVNNLDYAYTYYYEGIIKTASDFIDRIFYNRKVSYFNGVFNFFKTRFDGSWSPTKNDNWVCGVIFLQNDSYEYSIIGNILCVDQGGKLYIGNITHSNKVVSIKWTRIV